MSASMRLVVGSKERLSRDSFGVAAFRLLSVSWDLAAEIAALPSESLPEGMEDEEFIGKEAEPDEPRVHRADDVLDSLRRAHLTRTENRALIAYLSALPADWPVIVIFW